MTDSVSELDYLKTLDDLIPYRISFKPHSEFQLNDEESQELVVMMSADKEQYKCFLPVVETNLKKRIESYSGPTPLDLLKPLHADSACSYRIDSYWMYEICHGRYVLQYHEDKETKSRSEFYLGNYAKVATEMEANKFDQLNPPTRKFDKDEIAYYPVIYDHGTTCDITNAPRQTTILYVCDEDHKTHVYSVTEIKSCQYEIVIMTNRLCAHPSFQKTPAEEHDIRCFPVSESQPNPKPKNLLNMERESTAQFFREFTTAGKGSGKSIFRFLQQDEDSDGLDQLNMILEALRGVKKGVSLPTEGLESAVPSNAPKIIEQFWNGKSCLTGGTGWWKYEICHGRTVVQYHEEPGKPRQNIVLGVFHKEIHKQWIGSNPQKARRMIDGQVQQVAHLYSQGDVCTETGAHRSCEVRMRCLETKTKESASKILIYLLEPTTCSYILVIESAQLCTGLQHSDEYGIILDTPELDGNVAEPKEVSSKNHFNNIQIIERGTLEDATTPNPHFQDNANKKEDFIQPKESNKNNEKLFNNIVLDQDAVVELVRNLANDIEHVNIIKKEIILTDGNDDMIVEDNEQEKKEENDNKQKIVHDEN